MRCPQTNYLSQSICGLLLISVAAAMLAGCGSGGGEAYSGPEPALPASPPAVTPTNLYLGTQSPGLWTITLDDQNNLFSYQPITYPAKPNTPTTGTTKNVNGFLQLSLSNAQPAGYAVEMPSQGVILRPGDMSTFPIFAVQQTSCFPLDGKLRLQGLLTTAGPNDVSGSLSALGTNPSVVASTNSTGTSWQFIDAVNGYQQPTSFDGTCAGKNGQAVISVPITSANSVPATFVVGQTGLTFTDYSPIFATTSAIGFAQPASPLNVSTITGVNYRGFSILPGAGSTYTTQLLSFSPAASSSSLLVGGNFPNDDPNQTSNTNFTLSLGKQDPNNNGSFPNASITFPDPGQLCAISGEGTVGVDANGNPTCSQSATALVGSIGESYAIYLYSAHSASGATYQYFYTFYLFQQ